MPTPEQLRQIKQDALLAGETPEQVATAFAQRGWIDPDINPVLPIEEKRTQVEGLQGVTTPAAPPDPFTSRLGQSFKGGLQTGAGAVAGLASMVAPDYDSQQIAGKESYRLHEAGMENRAEALAPDVDTFFARTALGFAGAAGESLDVLVPPERLLSSAVRLRKTGSLAPFLFKDVGEAASRGISESLLSKAYRRPQVEKAGKLITESVGRKAAYESVNVPKGTTVYNKQGNRLGKVQGPMSGGEGYLVDTGRTRDVAYDVRTPIERFETTSSRELARQAGPAEVIQPSVGRLDVLASKEAHATRWESAYVRQKNSLTQAVSEGRIPEGFPEDPTQIEATIEKMATDHANALVGKSPPKVTASPLTRKEVPPGPAVETSGRSFEIRPKTIRERQKITETYFYDQLYDSKGRRLSQSADFVQKDLHYENLGASIPEPSPGQDVLEQRGALASLGAWVRSGVAHAFSPETAFPRIASHFRDPAAKKFFTKDMPRFMSELSGSTKARMNAMGRIHRAVALDVSDYAKASGDSVQDIAEAITKAREAGDITLLPGNLGRPDGSVAKAFQSIDELSEELLQKGMVSPDQADTIKSNIGRYYHVSHAKYDVKDWASHIEGTATWERFDRYLRETQPAMTADERLATMYDVADGNPKGLRMFSTKLGGKENLSELIKRKDIPAEVRDFMGVHRDFLMNFDKTTMLMATDIERTAFLRQVASRGLDTGVFSATPKGPLYKEVQLSKLSPPVYTTPETADLFEGIANPKASGSAFGFLSGLVKVGKVVFSPGTQMRNFESGISMSMANGMLHRPALFAKSFGRSVAASALESRSMARPVGKILKSLKKDPKKLEALVQEGLQHNVLREGAVTGELKDYMNMMETYLSGKGKIRGLTRAPLQKEIAKVRRSAPYRSVADAGNAVKNVFLRAYQLGDDIWKLTGYQYRKEELRWVMGLKPGQNISDAAPADVAAFKSLFGTDDLNSAASDLVRNTFQSYENAPRIAKSLGRNPITSPFVSFQAEMPRNVINILKTAGKEARMAKATGNTRWNALAASRVAGVVEAMTGFFAVSHALNNRFGVTEKGMEAFRRSLARDYNANAAIVVTNRDEEKKTVTYFDGGHSDPYTQMSKPLVAMLSEPGDITDKVGSALEELDDIYLGNELLFGAVLEQVLNARIDSGIVESATKGRGAGSPLVNPEDPASKQLKDRAFMAHRRLSPGGVVSGERILRALGVLDNSKFNLDAFNELLALGGPRMITVDLKKQLGHQLRELNERRRLLTRSFTNTEDQANASERWEDIWSEALTLSQDFQEWGLTKKDMIDVARKAGFRKELARSLVIGHDVTFAVSQREPRARGTF